jgi:hypothetical protein
MSSKGTCYLFTADDCMQEGQISMNTSAVSYTKPAYEQGGGPLYDQYGNPIAGEVSETRSLRCHYNQLNVIVTGVSEYVRLTMAATCHGMNARHVRCACNPGVSTYDVPGLLAQHMRKNLVCKQTVATVIFSLFFLNTITLFHWEHSNQ